MSETTTKPTPEPLSEIEKGTYLTVKEAAQFLGIETSSLRTFLWKGLFKTYKYKSLTLLSWDEVERWKARQPRKIGRP